MAGLRGLARRSTEYNQGIRTNSKRNDEDLANAHRLFDDAVARCAAYGVATSPKPPMPPRRGRYKSGWARRIDSARKTMEQRLIDHFQWQAAEAQAYGNAPTQQSWDGSASTAMSMPHHGQGFPNDNDVGIGHGCPSGMMWDTAAATVPHQQPFVPNQDQPQGLGTEPRWSSGPGQGFDLAPYDDPATNGARAAASSSIYPAESTVHQHPAAYAAAANVSSMHDPLTMPCYPHDEASWGLGLGLGP